MARSGVADLQVFQRAYALSLEVHQASLAFPQIEQFALADQIRRASKSICVNRYVVDLGYIEAQQAAKWQREYQMISAMLNALLRKVLGVAES